MPERSDREELLLPSVARGEAGAARACIERFGPLVWSLVRGSIKDHAQAEDAVQEIFIAVWQAAGRFDPSLSSETGFVATIARRRLIDRYRSRMRKPVPEPIEDVEIGGQDTRLEQVDTCDEARLAAEALGTLKADQRRLLEMSIVGNLTHREIAQQTGLPLGTVKSQIRRGLMRVRERLQASGADDTASISEASR